LSGFDPRRVWERPRPNVSLRRQSGTLARPRAEANPKSFLRRAIRATLDVDTLVAGTLASAGAAHDLILFWRAGFFELIASNALVDEFTDVLARPRIAKRYGITPQDIEALASEILPEGLIYPDPKDPPRLVPGDPNDDYLVALALAARADLVVSRDGHLHRAALPDLKVLYPAEFCRLLEASELR